MNAYPYSEAEEPGTWRYVMAEDGERAVLFVCPDCGTRGAITESEFEIDKQGEVFPTLTCSQENECSFNFYITLKDWQGWEVCKQ